MFSYLTAWQVGLIVATLIAVIGEGLIIDARDSAAVSAIVCVQQRHEAPTADQKRHDLAFDDCRSVARKATQPWFNFLVLAALGYAVGALAFGAGDKSAAEQWCSGRLKRAP
jgi:hypothetical protein